MMKRSCFCALILSALLFASGCAGRRTEELPALTALTPDAAAPTASAQPGEPSAPGLTAAPEATSAPTETVSALPFPRYGKWGLITPTGETLIPFEYEHVEALDTPGLFLLSRYDKTRELGSELHAVADAKGTILTDWLQRYPYASREALMIFPDEAEGQLLAPETGEVFYRIPGRLSVDYDYPENDGGALLVFGKQTKIAEVFSISDLKAGKTEPVLRLETKADFASLQEAGEYLILYLYGPEPEARLLDRQGHDLGYSAEEILILYESDFSGRPSGNYLLVKEKGEENYALLRLADRQVVLRLGPEEAVHRVSGDLAAVEVYTEPSYIRIVSLSTGKDLSPDYPWDRAEIDPDGRAYAGLRDGSLYEVTNSGLRFIAQIPASWDRFRLGNQLIFARYNDEGNQELYSFDRETLQPTDFAEKYAGLSDLSWTESTRALYLARRPGFPVYDLLDGDGETVLSAIKGLRTPPADRYVVIEQGFTLGVFDLETREWAYKTGAFSTMED